MKIYALKTSTNYSYRRIFRLLALSILVFLLIYNISFKSFPVLTTGRLSILILLFWAIFLMKKNPILTLKSPVLLLFVPLPYVAVQYFLFGDSGQLSRFFHLGVYSVLGASLVALISRNPRDAMFCMLLAILYQAIFLPYAFVSPSYRDWYSVTVESGANFDADYLYRTSGFSGYSGAALSVIQSLGVFVGWLLLRNGHLGGLTRARPIMVCMLIIFVSCFLVGRTGLVLSAIFLLLFMLDPDKFNRARLASYFPVVAFSVGLGYFIFDQYFVESLSDDFSWEYFSQWAFGFLWGEDQTITAISEMNIPALRLDTIFGTGLVSLVDGLNPSGNDSGFIQTYYSMGLLMAIFMYLSYAYVLYYSLHFLPIVFRLFSAVTFFMLEFKEPFLFKYSLLFVILVLHFSYLKSRSASSPKTGCR